MKEEKVGLTGGTIFSMSNMMGSGILLLPATLAAIGGLVAFSWVIAIAGMVLGLGLSYAFMGAKNPQQGGVVAYAGEISPLTGYITASCYFNANWIGNLAIAVTGVGYIAMISPHLSFLRETWFNTLFVIALVWIFAFVNIKIGTVGLAKISWIGLLFCIFMVVGVATFGWFFFDPHLYSSNWNVTSENSLVGVAKGIVPCIWAFVGIESVVMIADKVRNPEKNVFYATVISGVLTGIIYILATSVMFGLIPANLLSKSSAPFGDAVAVILSGFHVPDAIIIGGLLGGVVGAILCLPNLANWMSLTAESAKRGAKDGYFPEIFGEVNSRDVPVKNIIITASMMTVFQLLTAVVSKGGAAGLFTMITSIAVLLTLVPYCFSCISLFMLERSLSGKCTIGLIVSLIGILFCLIAIVTSAASSVVGVFVVLLLVILCYASKKGYNARIGKNEKPVLNN